jgi:hypothetical protein
MLHGPPRESGSVSTKADVARIKDFLKQNPVQGKRKRILVCTASSGGGHEATTQGLKDLLAEVRVSRLIPASAWVARLFLETMSG